MHDLTVVLGLFPLVNSIEKLYANLNFYKVFLGGISKSTWLYNDLSTTVVPLNSSQAVISIVKISSKNSTESEFFLYKYAASQVIQSDPHCCCIMYVLLLYSPPCCAAICQYLC